MGAIKRICGVDMGRYNIFKNGTASASSVTNGAAANAFDGVLTSPNYWGAVDGANEWLKYDLGVGVTRTINKYRIYFQETLSYNVDDWTFEGSNDDSAWTTLDTQTNQATVVGWKEYVIFNTTAYRYYRLNVSANAGGGFMVCFEIEAFERTKIKKISGKTNTENELFTNGLFSDANLQGYWRLEDVNDSGPNGYNLTNVNTATFVSGIFNNAVNLVKTSTQYLYNASFADITGSLTVTAWVYSNQDGDWQAIVQRGNASSQGWDFFKRGDSNKLRFYCYGLTTNVEVTSSSTIKTGGWHHVVGIYDSANSKLKVFLDGVKTEVTASGSIAAYSGNLQIANNVNYFYGIIDDVAIFNRALTDAEVLSIYLTQIKKFAGVSNV